MSKTLSIAALFFAAGSVAATASLLTEPTLTGDASLTAGTANQISSRGSRAPLASVAMAESTVGNQPRRGERSDFDHAGTSRVEPTADGHRRGTR